MDGWQLSCHEEDIQGTKAVQPHGRLNIIHHLDISAPWALTYNRSLSRCFLKFRFRATRRAGAPSKGTFIRRPNGWPTHGQDCPPQRASTGHRRPDTGIWCSWHPAHCKTDIVVGITVRTVP